MTLRLKKRDSEQDWVHINTNSIGCRSYLGRRGRKQEIKAGGCLDPRVGGSSGKLLHEFMHALGEFESKLLSFGCFFLYYSI